MEQIIDIVVRLKVVVDVAREDPKEVAERYAQMGIRFPSVGAFKAEVLHVAVEGNSPEENPAAGQSHDIIRYAFKHYKYAQGTKECIAFYRGANWALTPLEKRN